MKKFVFLATAAAMLAGCSNDSFVGEDNTSPQPTSQEGAIKFSTGLSAVTRTTYTGPDAAGKLKNNFVVEGVKSDGTISNDNPVFDHYNVNWKVNTANTTTSNTHNWEYVGQSKHAFGPEGDQTIKYWDYAKSQYDFIAYSKGEATAVYANDGYNKENNVLYGEITPASLGTSAYTIKGKASELAKTYIADLVTVYRDGANSNNGLGDYQKPVLIKFRSLSAKVRIALYETVPGYSVKEVKFYNANDDANPSTTAKLYTDGNGSNVFNEEGTYKVSYPTTGKSKQSETDYNKAHLQFEPATTGGTSTELALGALANFAGKEVAETAENVYLGRTSNAATFAGTNDPDHYYTVVLPNEDGAVLNLKVDYTLLSTDGSGETIKVTGATAQVPAVYAAWKSGYAYTYLFKISDNTNGKTNPGLDPVGLYPITFDAVVTETEDGVQETITTVAEPSITTYAEGKVVTSNNEYKVGTDIYISGVNTDGTTSNSVTLYSATLNSGSVSVISEETAKLAYDQGKTDYNSDKYDKTDVTLTQLYGASEVTTVPAVDGNTYTVNAIKFTPNDAGTYVARFETTGNKVAYKVIKVVAP